MQTQVISCSLSTDIGAMCTESFTRVAALCCNFCLFDSATPTQTLHKIFFVGRIPRLLDLPSLSLDELGLWAFSIFADRL